MFKKTLICTTTLLAFMLVSVANATEFINFQSAYGPAQIQNTEILMPWANSFKEITKGEIEIESFSINGLVEGSLIAHALRDGLLDSGVWSASALPKETPYASSIVNMPFNTKSSQHGTTLLWTAYETIPEVKANIDSPGVLLAQWTSASFGISSVNSAIRTPADLKGKRVMLITAADSGIIEAWGGVPVYVSISDVYIGLQRGMAEAFYAPIPYQKGLKLGEIIKHLTVIPSSATSMILTINRALFNDLKPEIQELFLKSTGKEFSLKMAKHLDADVKNCLADFKASGVAIAELNPEELQVFNTALDGIRTSYWVTYLKEIGIPDSEAWIKRVEELSASIPDPNM